MIFTRGSKRTSFACNSGEGLQSTVETVLGAYWPGISIDDDPPPYSPPQPSFASEFATAMAAVIAAVFAAKADDEVEERPACSSLVLSFSNDKLAALGSHDIGQRSGASVTNNASGSDDSINGNSFGLEETHVFNIFFHFLSLAKKSMIPIFCLPSAFVVKERKSTSNMALYFFLKVSVFLALSSRLIGFVSVSDSRKNFVEIRPKVLDIDATTASSSSMLSFKRCREFSIWVSALSNKAVIVDNNSSS
mmetsp:Transcript_11487/g.17651  ORF Transcript_11487/g.17651 Transcript_11487/m.17651 type:complete len:249 (-) Transcript_11487:3632-4378(-)